MGIDSIDCLVIVTGRPLGEIGCQFSTEMKYDEGTSLNSSASNRCCLYLPSSTTYPYPWVKFTSSSGHLIFYMICCEVPIHHQCSPKKSPVAKSSIRKHPQHRPQQ